MHLAEALLEGNGRDEIEIAPGAGRVSVGVAHVAFLRRVVIDVEGAPGNFGNQLEYLEQ